MKNPFKLLVVGILVLSGCTKNSITDPIQLKTFTKDHHETISMQDAKCISIANNLGGVIVTGSSLKDSLQIYLYKTIEAATKESAEIHFDDIKSVTTYTNDTFGLSIISPKVSADVSYQHCSLAVQIPYGMNCKIGESHGEIIVDQLSSNVFIENTEQKVQIDHHEGSCEVSSNNEISVNVVLPDTGYCHLNTNKGNVTLGIPINVNSKVDLKTENGSISYTDLVFTRINLSNHILTGILGTGAADISINTKQGDVKLKGL